MVEDYPYMMSNNKIAPILQKIQAAARPNKFTHEFLKKMGFTSTNDRAIIPMLKKLGFLLEDGTPTEYYDRLKDATIHPYVVGERIKVLYNDLFSINTNIQNASDDEIKGAISRITGKEAEVVNRYFVTFKTLCSLAKFEDVPLKTKKEKNIEEDSKVKSNSEPIRAPEPAHTKPGFYYNIQIHLPATTDISVYNAIFKSLKENLNM